MMQSFFKQNISVWLLGLLFASIRFWQFFWGKTLLFGDNYSLMVPGKLFTAFWLRQGILPLWNPLLFAGISWIGDINQSIFYPSTLLFLLFSPATALNATIILQLALTFVGAYFLARRLSLSRYGAYLVAIIWSGSPQIIGAVNNISTLQSLTFLPWIVWAGMSTRHSLRYAVILGSLVTLQLFGGYPQYALCAVGLSLIVSLASQWNRVCHSGRNLRNFIKFWLLAGGVSVGASAVVWLPFLSTLSASTRAVQSLRQAGAGSLVAGELIHVLLPTFFYNPAVGIKWGFLWNSQPNIIVYYGWFGLFLLGFSLRYFKRSSLVVRSLWLSAILSFIFAFGDQLPWFSLLKYIPLLHASRGASSILQIAALSAALLIGFSFDELRKQSFLRWKFLLQIMVVVAILSGISWLVIHTQFTLIWHKLDTVLAGKLSQSMFHTLQRDQLIIENINRVLTITSILFAMSLYFFRRKKYSLLLLIIALDLILNSSSYFFFAPQEIYDTNPQRNEIVSLLGKTDLTRYRVLTRNYNVPYTGFAAYWDALTVRQPFSDSYIDTVELTNYSHLQRMRAGATPDWNLVFGIPIINGYTTLLPIDVQKRFSTPNQVGARINNLPEIVLTNKLLADWAVGYYVRDNWFPLYDEVTPKNLITQTKNLSLYHLPAKPRIRLLGGGDIFIKKLRETPNELSFDVIVTQSKQLLIADRYDKNWRVIVNGQPSKIDNYQGMRSITLKQRNNRVHMWYEPRDFYIGLSISLITLLLSIIGLFVFRAKS